MILYIETENGLPKNHPALEDNLLQAFPAIPLHWERFVRVECPVPTIYQTFESQEPTYEKVDGVWTDVWSLRDMTAEEKAAKQQAVKDAWAVRPNAENFVAWVLNENTCQFEPPIPRPTEGNYFWQGTTLSWIERPPYPTDGQMYKLDFSTGTWILVTP